MKPYYEHAGITIYHGDCREVMEEWEGLRTKSFDLLLTDPPYGILANGSAATARQVHNSNSGAMAWDVAPTAETLARMIDLAKEHIIWGGLHLYLPPTFGYLVWDKQIDGLNFGECEVAWTSMRFAPRIFRYRAVGVDGGKQHPTQKPIALMNWCLSFSLKRRIVLDPFMGSGSTLIAAKQNGLNATGIEISEQYCEVAANRLSQDILPLAIPGPGLVQNGLW